MLYQWIHSPTGPRVFIKIWALAQSMGGRSKLFLMVSGGEDKVILELDPSDRHL